MSNNMHVHFKVAMISQSSLIPGPHDSGRALVKNSSNHELHTMSKKQSPLSTVRRRDAGGHTQSPAPLPSISVDSDGITYPEGGREGWLVLLGTFCGFFVALEITNSIGVYQAWISNNQLRDYGSASIGWIFGVYAFMTFFCGVQIGPVFDAQGPRILVLSGSIMMVIMLILLGFCSAYWHFMLVLGILGGLASSLIYTASIPSIGHYFFARRGMATGIAISGGSLSGIVLPLGLQALLPKVGFAWATRIQALLTLCLVLVACLLIRSRLPRQKITRNQMIPDFSILQNSRFAVTTVGLFFVDLGLFIPLSYLPSYALAHGMSEKYSYQILAFLNVGSFFGRCLPGYAADKIGRFNTLILTLFSCLVFILGIWLSAGSRQTTLTVYTVVYGLASGSHISLLPVCIGQLCSTEQYGRYYATAYTVACIGALVGNPLAGFILSRTRGEYWGLITFTACCYSIGLTCFVIVRIQAKGWNIKLKF